MLAFSLSGVSSEWKFSLPSFILPAVFINLNLCQSFCSDVLCLLDFREVQGCQDARMLNSWLYLDWLFWFWANMIARMSYLPLPFCSRVFLQGFVGLQTQVIVSLENYVSHSWLHTWVFFSLLYLNFVGLCSFAYFFCSNGIVFIQYVVASHPQQ